MSTNKTVAVIMSIYGGDPPEKLNNAIMSILNQTYKCHLYLYQDGPIDFEIKRILDSYIKNNDIFFYKDNNNKGLAHALNFLITKVCKKEYDYIARMDSDDFSYNDRIESQVKFLNLNPNIDLVGSYCNEYGSDFAVNIRKLPLTHNELKKISISKCPFIHPTVMFRSRCFDTGLRYPRSNLLSEDLLLWHKMIIEGYIFANIDRPLLNFYIDEATLKRRGGLIKSLAETKSRISFMIDSNQISFRNIILIFIRFTFQLSPAFIKRIGYKFFR